MGVRSLLGGGRGPRGCGFWLTGQHIAIVFSSLPGLETANIPQVPPSPCQEWAAELLTQPWGGRHHIRLHTGHSP